MIAKLKKYNRLVINTTHEKTNSITIEKDILKKYDTLYISLDNDKTSYTSTPMYIEVPDLIDESNNEFFVPIIIESGPFTVAKLKYRNNILTVDVGYIAKVVAYSY